MGKNPANNVLQVANIHITQCTMFKIAPCIVNVINTHGTYIHENPVMFASLHRSEITQQAAVYNHILTMLASCEAIESD